MDDEAAVAVIILLQCVKGELEAEGGELATWPGGVQLQRRGLPVQQDSVLQLRDVRMSHLLHSNFVGIRS